MTDAPESTNRSWLGEWLRAESFWREVASRTLSGVIVATLVAFAAAAIGVVDWNALVKGAVIVALLLLWIAATVYMYTRVARVFPRWSFSRGWVRVVAQAFLVVVATALSLVVIGGITYWLVVVVWHL